MIDTIKKFVAILYECLTRFFKAKDTAQASKEDNAVVEGDENTVNTTFDKYLKLILVCSGIGIALFSGCATKEAVYISSDKRMVPVMQTDAETYKKLGQGQACTGWYVPIARMQEIQRALRKSAK